MLHPLPRILIVLLALILCASPTLAVSPALVATSLDGRQTTGELVEWGAERVVLLSEGKEIELPVENLLNIRPADSLRTAEVGAYIQLTDESRLPLSAFAVGKHEATVGTPLAKEPVQLSTDDVQLVQFSSRAKEDAAFWSELAEGRLSGDVLMVQQNNEGQIEHLTGVLGDISEEQVQFNWDGQNIPVKRTKVIALAYYHRKTSEWPPAACQLTTTSGARLSVAEIQRDEEQQQLSVTTLGGIKLTLPVNSLVAADYSAGKLTYLSDLEPLKTEWTPRIALPESAELIHSYGLPRRDQSYSGSSLTLAWPSERTGGPVETKTYPKGLALRSRTVLEYRVPTGMNRLVALAGIDPATSSQGNVSLEISGDDSVLWQGEIDGKSAPVAIDVPLGQARRLRLVVDYGGNLDYGDRLHLVDARITK